MQMAIERAREANPEIKIGVCGEHGGDPESIEFLETLGLNYVSCSPARIPAARLAIAQTAIASEAHSFARARTYGDSQEALEVAM
jgi:pyruvate, orthophosphate dikinase